MLLAGKAVGIGSRAFDVLLALIERRSRLVLKGELLDLIWGDLVVDEHNLATQVSTLRGLLGKDVISTIPGRGYRFASAVVECRQDSATEPVPALTVVDPSGPASTNLPAVLAPLYGRDRDLVELRARLMHRLVTVVGAGGVGKTRLAQAAAQGLARQYPDGVWFVELAPLTDAAGLPFVVARALGIALDAHGPAVEELITALEGQKVLLILDNAEPWLDTVASLSQALLDHAPSASLLLTSQVPLGLPNEQVFRLEPLAVPSDPEAADAFEYGAVRLFTERAAAADRHFTPSRANVAAVVDICRRLDGLALAIELAAARVPFLGVEGVRERLGDRLLSLARASQVVPPRQQTLRATLDWSHQLLAPAEREVFRRLAVFSGGFTLEAAQRVVADDRLDARTVFDVLHRLVERSLVVAGRGERPRLSLLETMAAYAGEQLAEAGEAARLQQRHAEHYADHFENLAEALYAGALSEGNFVLARAREADNLRQSIDAALGVIDDRQLALRLLVAAAPMAHLLPLRVQALRWWRTIGKSVDTRADSPQAAWLRFAWIHWGQSVWWFRSEWPVMPHTTAASLRSLNDPRRQAHALCVLALQLSGAGKVALAQAALAEAAALERRTGRPGYGRGVHCFAPGSIANREGRARPGANSRRHWPICRRLAKATVAGPS